MELISDTGMYLFVEKGIGGSIPYITKRYSKVNKKYKKFYDDIKLGRYIMCLDPNNLHG